MRYNPALAGQGKNPLVLDSKAPTLTLDKFENNETRFTMLNRSDPEAAKRLLESAQAEVNARWRLYEHWAAMPMKPASEQTSQPAGSTEEKPQ
jgi:pyruvate-ferredoxin/flavodoxin oxidoreductase